MKILYSGEQKEAKREGLLKAWEEIKECPYCHVVSRNIFIEEPIRYVDIVQARLFGGEICSLVGYCKKCGTIFESKKFKYK